MIINEKINKMNLFKIFWCRIQIHFLSIDLRTLEMDLTFQFVTYEVYSIERGQIEFSIASLREQILSLQTKE